MVTVIYNLSKPEQGGVGRYAYEFLKRLRNKIDFSEIDLSPSFGKTTFQKMLSIMWKRKGYLLNKSAGYDDINHFLQTEIFYPIKGRNIVTLHNPPPFTKAIDGIAPDFYSLVRSVLFLNRYKDAVNNAEFIVADSDLVKEGVVEMGFEKNKVKVIGLGVDEKFKIIKGYDSRKNLIGFVGSFGKHKRVRELLGDWRKSFDNLNKYRLEVYTGGVQNESLIKKYDKNFNITFRGQINKENSIHAYNSFKAFMMSSRGEGFGLPIIEAVACGCPVFIYTDSKISPEIRKYCIEIDSVSEIPEKLENVKYGNLTKKSKDVKKIFNWDRNVDDTLKLYKKL